VYCVKIKLKQYLCAKDSITDVLLSLCES
jgi:hypothetical protein